MSRQSLAQMPRCYLFLATLLFGCSNGGGFYGPTKQHVVPKTEVINVTNGHFNVSPPLGFCKDTGGSKNTETSTFLMFADCGYINSGGRLASRDASFSGLVTTSIAKKPTFQNGDSIETLSGFLSSEQGLKSLSTSGNADTVAIVDRRQTSDGVFLQLHDSNAALSKNVWKSFLNRSDHLVTVTLLQNKDAPQSPEQAMQFLQGYSETIKLSTGKSDALPPKNTVVENQSVTIPKINGLKKVGILRWLFL